MVQCVDTRLSVISSDFSFIYLKFHYHWSRGLIFHGILRIWRVKMTSLFPENWSKVDAKITPISHLQTLITWPIFVQNMQTRPLFSSAKPALSIARGPEISKCRFKKHLRSLNCLQEILCGCSKQRNPRFRNVCD